MPFVLLLVTLSSVLVAFLTSGAPASSTLPWSDPPLTVLPEPPSAPRSAMSPSLYQLPTAPPPLLEPLPAAPVRTWPDARVPYQLSPGFTWRDRSVIAQAFGVFQRHTCVRLVPHSTESDFIDITSGSPGRTVGCNAFIGRQGGRQSLRLGPGCVHTGIILHELMHSVGFRHEQERPDRDKYVIIRWESILPARRRWFQSRPSGDHGEGALRLPYDYRSIMHYTASDFAARPGQVTMVPRRSGARLGRGSTLTWMDVIKMNVQYGCEKDPAGLRRPLIPIPRYRP